MPVSQRQIVRACKPESARHGGHFEALRMGATIFGPEGDPWLNLDHFRMAGPTFPPHRDAGFSAVTYILRDSRGGMANRDSRGDRSLIDPGGLHWTAAGRGIVHEEIPAEPGSLTEGFQIFIRQPVEQEGQPPAIAHVDAESVPVIALPTGGTVRILAGEYDGRSVPFATPSPIAMFDLLLDVGQEFLWTPPAAYQSLSLYLFAGALAEEGADAVGFAAPLLLVFARDSAPLRVTAGENGTRVLVMAGKPLNAPSVSNGPFVLSSPAALEEAVGRYRSGAMGALSPEWD